MNHRCERHVIQKNHINPRHRKQELNLIHRHAVISQLKACLPYKIVKVSFDSTDDTAVRDSQFTGHLTAQDAFKMWHEKQVYQDKALGAAVYTAGMEVLA